MLMWKVPMFPNGVITTYQIRYRTTVETVGDSKYHYQNHEPHSEVQRTEVTGLEQGTDYVFSVSVMIFLC